MPLLSDFAQQQKIKYFFKDIPKDAQILEVGSGTGWLGKSLQADGWQNYKGLDLFPPADFVGEIQNWKQLGLKENSFDVIVAFELIEHIHCFHELHALLKPGGSLFLTSPLPHMDWLCHSLEVLGLNQKRSSPHDHLIYFEDIPLFERVEIKIVGFMAQWGKFQKPLKSAHLNYANLEQLIR